MSIDDNSPFEPTPAPRTGSGHLLQIGAVFAGRYAIQKYLRPSAMGEVYLAEDEKLGRRITIEALDWKPGGNQDTIRRFYREAKATARLDHPNLCTVFDADIADGMPFLLMAHVPGELLADRLKNGPPFEPREAVAVARTVALALHEAHRQNILHRNLAPENIILNPQRGAVVTDFSLAWLLEEEEAFRTHAGTSLANPIYMSPEQLEGEDRMGAPSDEYSLGVILYQMLTGKPPFHGRQLEIVIHHIKHTIPRPPSELRPGVSPRLDDVCLRALAKSPAERFTTLSDFAAALGDALSSPASQPSPTPVRPTPETSRPSAFAASKPVSPAPSPPLAPAPPSPPPPSPLTLPLTPSPLSPSPPLAPTPVRPLPTSEPTFLTQDLRNISPGYLPTQVNPPAMGRSPRGAHYQPPLIPADSDSGEDEDSPRTVNVDRVLAPRQEPKPPPLPVEPVTIPVDMWLNLPHGDRAGSVSSSEQEQGRPRPRNRKRPNDVVRGFLAFCSIGLVIAAGLFAVDFFRNGGKGPQADEAKAIPSSPSKITTADDSKVDNTPSADEATKWAALGKEQFEKRDFDQAIESYTKALEAGTDASPSVRSQRGRAYLYANQLPRAMADLDEALKAEPSDAAARAARACARWQFEGPRRAGTAALADAEEALKANDREPLALAVRGAIEAGAAPPEIDKAVADCNTAVEDSPDDALVRALRCYVLVKKRDLQNDPSTLEQASADAKKAIELDTLPECALAYLCRGLTHQASGDIEKAVKDCDQAIQLMPDNPGPYYQRARFHFNSHQYGPAIADDTKAIDLNPKFVDALNSRGRAHIRKNEVDEAIADYTQAIELDPEFAEVYSNRGTAWRVKGDFPKAHADFSKAIELDKNLSEAWYGRGDVATLTHDYDRALNDYTRALEIKDTFAYAYFGRGNVYCANGDYDAAIADYDKAIELGFSSAKSPRDRAIAARQQAEAARKQAQTKGTTKAVETKK